MLGAVEWVSANGGRRNGRRHAAGRPNVVLIVSDQQRADTMPGAAHRPPVMGTPHLDWLAQRGMLFRSAFCASPLCTPARVSLLSGIYPHATGMVANHQPRPITEEMRLPADVPLLADYLKPLGYVCAYTGNWHLGTGSDRRGFSDLVTRSADFDVDGPHQNETLWFGAQVGTPTDANYVRNYDPARFDRRIQVGPSLLPLAFHPATRDAYAAAHFIRMMAIDPPHRPFCLVYSCHEPHQPFVSPRPFDTAYLPEQMWLPKTLRDPAAVALAQARGQRLKAAAQWNEDDLRRMWAAYGGAVSYVDHLVGIVLEALISTEAWENTLFVFTSDHGEMLGSHGLLFKGEALFEELVNVPLLVVPPGGLAAPHETGRLVTHIDLVPTLLRWCGAEVPAALQGKDIRALIKGGDVGVHDGVALEYHSTDWGEHPMPLRGWRTEDWKYVEVARGPGVRVPFGAPRWEAESAELYDLTNDPLETRNLIHEPAYAAQCRRLRDQLYGWLGESGDRWPEVALPREFLPPRGGARSRRN
ncbi:MAG: sulfatase-like hydrolase/transferase [Chloroflexi bacterium]|nr:sulfatase-like hydrolase/transferase [Chloroflexota bacterium]